MVAFFIVRSKVSLLVNSNHAFSSVHRVIYCGVASDYKIFSGANFACVHSGCAVRGLTVIVFEKRNRACALERTESL